MAVYPDGLGWLRGRREVVTPREVVGRRATWLTRRPPELLLWPVCTDRQEEVAHDANLHTYGDG
ncbi:hypothetical protein EV644_111171 [Kribbella orskensis]|uniref:Uncharacterized protein n=1 Tax=Kribbella orskensis TaxID=2512216 RepID=A0ABY2BGM4_9ACTN|nr:MULTISPECIES: hypothetical protein [Kribbella]TCN37565.1 hypothetical protein EV642_11194 [Kribbella sp. VKM Ac-2500]TCO18933.1 hypothetical protein EV644_111171 [Kribbella orskensis]